MNSGGLLRQVSVIDQSQFYLSSATIAGAFANVALNFVLIPRMGIAGAATASVIAYAIPGYIYTLFSAKTRYLASLLPASPILCISELLAQARKVRA